MKTRWKALASAVVAAALVIAPLTVTGASAHTGDLHATASCNTDTGKYTVTYTLETSNVPAGRTGSTVWRIGDSHFDGTPTNATGMANPVGSTGNQTITLGTAALAGTTVGAGPWVYAFTTWKDDQGHVVATKGSDTQVLGLTGDCAPIKKVFVCKYVGTPGVDERLQTGDNPISVSVNAIPEWNGNIPSWFTDQHGRSYVIAYDIGQDKPTKANCAAAAPTVVTPKPPVVKDKCETANDHYGLPAETIGVSYTRSGKNIIATPASGYVFGTLPAGWTLNADKAAATYAFQSSQFTNNENCEEIVPVPAVFSALPVAPTCTTDGALPSLGDHPNVTLTWNNPFTGPGKYTLTATANAGFEFSEGVTVLTHEFTVAGKLAANSADCPPVTTPVPAVFSAVPVAPTCLTEGALPTLGEHPNVSLAFDREYTGPGVYTLTATANEGYAFPGGDTVKTQKFTVAGKLAPQSTDEAASCYQAPAGDPVPSGPATPATTPTPAALPATGGVDMLPWGIGGAAMLLAGAAALIMTRRFARR